MQLYPPSHYDDKANGYTKISTRPLASAMGAEICGVDLSKLEEGQFEEIKAALFHYKMLYFRNQHISLEDQENFTLRFGAFGTDAYTSGMPGHPDIQRILKEADTVVSRVFGDGWHTDSPFLQKPPAISLLYSKDIPPYGGDTWWSNTELAYDFLSPTLKTLLAPLRVHMSAREVIRNILETSAPDKLSVGPMQLSMDQQKIVEGSFHPLVRTHPETKKKSLYVDETYSLGIQGLTSEEAAPLLGYLQKHIKREEFSCRLRWERDMLVMWDNRICVHKAFNDYDGYRREMLRTIVDGEVPV
ncbi:MAG: TauD/TfdA family dioxygenase [Pseudomonadales bacterium]|nr:TauD/TfdA family dioxygenase [Pseudomonadales bacterium]